jgi:hypothetical protein
MFSLAIFPVRVCTPRGETPLVAQLVAPEVRNDAKIGDRNPTLRHVNLAIRVLLVVPGVDPIRLVWTDRHPDSVAGCGVLRYKNRSGRLDISTFRRMRDEDGARLVTNHMGRVCRALGVSVGEPGIEEVAE